MRRTLTGRLPTLRGAHTAARPAQIGAMACALLAVAGCGSAAAPPAGAPPPLEALVFGGTDPCMTPSDCPGGVCTFGSCVGALLADARWMQQTIAERLVAALDGRPASERATLAREAAAMVRPKEDEPDLALRARAVRVLEALEATETLLDLHEALEAHAATDERLAGAVALALTRLGQTQGVAQARAMTEDGHPAIAAEALRALGASGHADDALVPLLRALGPSLDRVVVQAALDGLAELGDPRAIGPLVAFLEAAPEPLAHRTVQALRSLTSATIGTEHGAWESWVATASLPPAPRFEVRRSSAERLLGIPTP